VSTLQLETSLSDIDFVAFDTETTGLHPSSERIVELAAIRFRLDAELAQFDRLIDPGVAIPPGAERVHGIRDADVRGKPSCGEILPEFAAFVEGAVLLAHNAEFDVGFLAHEAKRHGVRLPRLPVFDTVEMARTLRPDLPNHKLETLSKAFSCQAPTYHRALADAQTLRQVFHRLCEHMAEPKLGSLLETTTGALSFGPNERLSMWLPPQLAALDEALSSGGRVTILYEAEGKRQDTCEIVPLGWKRRLNGTFLMARGEGERGDRSFRLDWIKRAQHAQASLF
jgi:DNA polymerase III epsilon subunit family exonuclease